MSGVLVVYYTRGGNSEKIAHDISTKLNGVIDEIKLEKESKGTLAYMKNTFDAYFENTDPIRYEIDPKDYTSIVIVSPIIAGKIPSAVRQYVAEKHRQDEELRLHNEQQLHNKEEVIQKIQRPYA